MDRETWIVHKDYSKNRHRFIEASSYDNGFLLDVIIKMIAVENKFYYYLQFMLHITSIYNFNDAISFNIFLILPSKENTNLQTLLILMTS